MRCQFFFILAVHSSNYCKQFYLIFACSRRLVMKPLCAHESRIFVLVYCSQLASLQTGIFFVLTYSTRSCAHMSCTFFLGNNFLYSSDRCKQALFLCRTFTCTSREKKPLYSAHFICLCSCNLVAGHKNTREWREKKKKEKIAQSRLFCMLLCYVPPPPFI